MVSVLPLINCYNCIAINPLSRTNSIRMFDDQYVRKIFSWAVPKKLLRISCHVCNFARVFNEQSKLINYRF